MKTPDLKAIEHAFYSDGFQLGMKVGSSPSKMAISNAVQELFQLVDTMIDSFSEYAIQQQQKIDCKKGCSWCCFQPVFALDYELEYFNSFISKKISASKLASIREKAKKKREKLQGLDNKALLYSKYVCPLLENGVCLAYDARPVACRIYLSSDVNSCVKFYHDPETEDSYPVLLNFPMHIGRIINEGFKNALKTSGISPKEFRIEEKL